MTINLHGSCEKPSEEQIVRKRATKINFTGNVFMISRPSLINTYVKINITIYYPQIVWAYSQVYTRLPYDHSVL